MSPTWTSDMIWWHVYPLGFTGAERSLAAAGPDPVPRLAQLESWLDYAVTFGANGLLLGPIFRSATHGYDTLDHYEIDPRLGTMDTFSHLVAACRSKGIRVALDGVFNHVGRESPIVQRALKGGPGSRDGRWIRWTDGQPRSFEGHDALVELNLSEPAVIRHVVSVVSFWTDMGADAWRFDAAYAPGADAWHPITEAIRFLHPGTWMLGEVIHGDYADFVERSGMHSVTQYELWKAVWSSIATRNFWELAHALGRHRAMVEHFVPYTFVGNHDTTRIASQISDSRHLEHAVALLALLPGIPGIYAGDEQAFTGVKTESATGDDAVRPPFPDNPYDLLPFGRSVYDLHQRLLGLRRRNRWLVDATVTTRDLENEYVVVELTGADGERLDVVLSLCDQPRQLPPGSVLEGSDRSSSSLEPHGWAVIEP
ncbi:MAG TPA: alpha-amylase family glycosyl hydrolase [Propionibacteriaceae bacterium]|nr:alpha-amylase family glycosyl hydrolase [Propionibacteriaceae bacterium]